MKPNRPSVAANIVTAFLIGVPSMSRTVRILFFVFAANVIEHHLTA